MRWVVFVLAVALGCGDDAPSCPPPPNAGECVRDADCCPEGNPCDAACGLDLDTGDGTLRCVPTVGPASIGTGAVGTDCDAPTGCRTGLCLAAGRCVRACGDDDDCAPTERCGRRWVRTDGGHAEATACAPLASVPPLAADTLGGSEPSLRATVAGAHQVLLPRCDARPTPVQLRNGSGDVLYDATAPGLAINPVFAPFPGPFTVVLPNGPTYAGFDQIHTVRLDREATLDHRVFAPPTGSRLDLDVFVLGVEVPPPGTFDTLAAVLANAGLTLGDVRTHALEGPLAARFAVLDGVRGELPDLNALIALAAGSGPSVPVFLIRHMDFFLGLAGGIPGAPMLPGSPSSAVVIGAEDAGSQLGLVLAHEVAHLLGLFHLVEPDGTVLEPLPTTPACPASADGDGDGLLDADECAAFGSDNLMFWSLDRATTALDDAQAAILRGAPILH